jgi:poly(beta-D-mannuronate) lyase
MLRTFFLSIALLSLLSCGGSHNESAEKVNTIPSDSNNNNQIPIVDIADIDCSVNYPLAIETVTLDSDHENIAVLFDKDKTNKSAWQNVDTVSNLIIKLTEPALVKSFVASWKDLSLTHHFNIYASKNATDWTLVSDINKSEGDQIIPDVVDLTNLTNQTAQYLKLELNGDENSSPSSLVELEVFGCEHEAAHNIELIDWYLSVPTDSDNNGKSDSITESMLSNGYFDPRFFILTKDNGIRFSTSVSGYRTSTNTKYVRSELREMLRRGNTSYSTQGVNGNNWVFSSAPTTDQNNAGGVDGELTAELAINHVTTTGENYQIGRVIIGQIHANDDEPARLYYRKLPNNTKGSIYIAHELLAGDDSYYEIIGSRSDVANDPVDGIALNEKFSYTIKVVANELTVTITKSDGSQYSKVIDMSDSGYDKGGQYMYFKAGVYNQNNSGDINDYAQVTFYQISNSHKGY